MVDAEQDGSVETPAWVSQLPADLKTNEAFTGFATLGDFAKSHLEAQGKLTEFDGKVKKLEGDYANLKENSIPKLPADATDEEKGIYYQELGRPEKWNDYELPSGDGKDAQEWTDFWKQTFFSLNVSKDTANGLSQTFNSQMQKLVDAHNANVTKQIEESATKLRGELGDKYDASVELAQRLWKNHTDTDFDESFKVETSANRYAMVKFLLKVAKMTGEDQSPPGGRGGKPGAGNDEWFPNSPKSPSGK
jgi:hypothetical protein